MGFNPDPSKLNPTEAALLARGIDSDTASRLRQKGWTLGKLKQTSVENLAALGLREDQIGEIRRGRRPAIPFPDLARVLVANRFTCCVCRDSTKAIVVHHVHEWSESHDHSSDNLAVLCSEHHDKAHTTSRLTQNLDPRLVKEMKVAWEELIARTDISAVLQASRSDGDAWWYFNHVRLFEMAAHLELPLNRLPTFRAALASRLVDSKGFLRSRSGQLLYMYSGSEGMQLYAYVRDVLEAVLDRLAVFNASDFLDRSVLPSVLKAGDFVVVQGAHNFSRLGGNDSGRDQVTLGVRKANHVEFRFTFDRWEATSTSAWGTWLKGRREAASVLRVVDFGKEGSSLVVEGTVFGICAALPGLKEREYASAPYRQGMVFYDDDEEENCSIWPDDDAN